MSYTTMVMNIAELSPLDPHWSPEKIALYVGAGVLIVGGGVALYFAMRTPPFGGVVVPGAHIMSGFGRRTVRGTSQYHLGEDIAAPHGTPIYMPVAGTVVKVWPDGEVGGYGNLAVVRLADEPKALLFAHMDRYAVQDGQVLRPGDVVGYVGSTDSEGGFSSSDSHLHLEVLLDDGTQRGYTHFHGGANWYPQRQDPQEWAAQRGVRLS